MTRLLLSVSFLLIGVGTVGTARGDVLKPGPKAETVFKTKLVVEVNDDLKEARLQIPRGLLQGKGDPRKTDAGALPTIVAGLALTLAFASGGFWLMRRGAGRGVTVALLALAVLALGATALWANAPITTKDFKEGTYSLPAVPLPAGIQLSEKLTIEIVEKGDTVKLLVNKSMVLKQDKETKGEESKKPVKDGEK
jgi:hypothetical protein